jgi:hypothetical protein
MPIHRKWKQETGQHRSCETGLSFKKVLEKYVANKSNFLQFMELYGKGAVTKADPKRVQKTQRALLHQKTITTRSIK